MFLRYVLSRRSDTFCLFRLYALPPDISLHPHPPSPVCESTQKPLYFTVFTFYFNRASSLGWLVGNDEMMAKVDSNQKP